MCRLRLPYSGGAPSAPRTHSSAPRVPRPASNRSRGSSARRAPRMKDPPAIGRVASHVAALRRDELSHVDEGGGRLQTLLASLEGRGDVEPGDLQHTTPPMSPVVA